MTESVMKIDCPYCRSASIQEIEHIVSPINQKTYTLMQCLHCCLQFFLPLRFENIYESELFDEYANFHTGRRSLPSWTKEMLQSMKALGVENLHHKKILEIGAGDGINFLALKEHYHIPPSNYYMIELDAKSVEQCRARGIKHITNAKFDGMTRSQIFETFDIILLLEVLEHQTSPKEFLNLVFSLLNQDGLIILTVPNRERFFLKHVEFQGDLPPHHFLRFNKSFFQKNFPEHLYSLEDFKHRYKIKSIKAATLKLLSKLHIPHFVWVGFFPLTIILYWMIKLASYIKGEGIIVILKNRSYSAF